MVTARLLTIFNVTVASFLCNGTSKPSPRASGKTLELNTKLQNFIYNVIQQHIFTIYIQKFIQQQILSTTVCQISVAICQLYPVF